MIGETATVPPKDLSAIPSAPPFASVDLHFHAADPPSISLPCPIPRTGVGRTRARTIMRPEIASRTSEREGIADRARARRTRAWNSSLTAEGGTRLIIRNHMARCCCCMPLTRQGRYEQTDTGAKILDPITYPFSPIQKLLDLRILHQFRSIRS